MTKSLTIGLILFSYLLCVTSTVYYAIRFRKQRKHRFIEVRRVSLQNENPLFNIKLISSYLKLVYFFCDSTFVFYSIFLFIVITQISGLFGVC